MAENALVDILIQKNEDFVKFYRSYLTARKMAKHTQDMDSAIIKLKQLISDCQQLSDVLYSQPAVERRNEEFSETVGKISKIVGEEITIKEEKENTVNSSKSQSKEEIKNSPPQEEVLDEKEVKSKYLTVSEQEFRLIPKYLLGRFTLSDLNEFTSKICEFLGYVDEIHAKPRKVLNKKELDFIENRRPLANKVSTIMFFLETDLKPLLPQKLTGLVRKVIPCLRHIKKVKETRVGASTVYFAEFF